MRWSRLAALVRRRMRYKITRGGMLFVAALIVVAAGPRFPRTICCF